MGTLLITRGQRIILREVKLMLITNHSSEILHFFILLICSEICDLFWIILEHLIYPCQVVEESTLDPAYNEFGYYERPPITTKVMLPNDINV